MVKVPSLCPYNSVGLECHPYKMEVVCSNQTAGTNDTYSKFFTHLQSESKNKYRVLISDFHNKKSLVSASDFCLNNLYVKRN